MRFKIVSVTFNEKPSKRPPPVATSITVAKEKKDQPTEEETVPPMLVVVHLICSVTKSRVPLMAQVWEMFDGGSKNSNTEHTNCCCATCMRNQLKKSVHSFRSVIKISQSEIRTVPFLTRTAEEPDHFFCNSQSVE